MNIGKFWRNLTRVREQLPSIIPEMREELNVLTAHINMLEEKIISQNSFIRKQSDNLQGGFRDLIIKQEEKLKMQVVRINVIENNVCGHINSMGERIDELEKMISAKPKKIAKPKPKKRKKP